MQDMEQPPMDSPNAAKVPWHPLLGVAFVVVWFFGAQLLAQLLLSIYPALKHWSANQANAWLDLSVAGQFVFVLLAEALTIGGIYWFVRRYKVGLGSIGLRRPRWRDPLQGLAALVPYYILYGIFLGIVGALWHGLNVNQKQELGFNNVQGTLPLVLTFISLVVLPPLAEEIMMRGLLFGSLRKALPVFWAALITSVLFASPHLLEGGNSGLLWIAGIDTFVLSMVLCYLRQWTGSLWPGITLHALKNGIAFALLYLAPLVHLPIL